jgi:signal transduction histidine kinase
MTFSDNGIGIPRGLRDKIFLPGTRARSKTVQAQVGAGLGLSVVRGIVRDHYGEVWVEHLKAPTQICVFLPNWLDDGRFLKFPEWQA